MQLFTVQVIYTLYSTHQIRNHHGFTFPHPEPYVRSAFYTSWCAATYRPSVFKNSMFFEFMVVMTENFFYGFAGTKKDD